MVDFTLLGTGATMPVPERGVTAAVLRCAGRGILFDCGEGTQTALRRFGVSPMRIDLIALTHYHGDHIFGLPGLLQTMSCQDRSEPLYLAGPEGLEEAAAPLLQLADICDYPIRLLTLPKDGLPLSQLNAAWPAGARCAAVPTVHRVPSQGYLFTLDRPPRFLPERARELDIPVQLWKQIAAAPLEPVLWEGTPLIRRGAPVFGRDVLGPARKGLRVIFSGDTSPCPALEEAARGADLLVHDATYGEDGQADEALLSGHSTFRQAAEIAAQAGAKRLWLTHFSQRMIRPEDALPFAKAVFPAAVCGTDGLSAALAFEGSSEKTRV